MADEKIKLTVEQAADRLLVVVYALAGGDTNIAVHKSAVFAECERIGLLTMTEAEFNDYVRSVGQMIAARRN